MTNGKNKDILRNRYETETGKKSITNKGDKSKGYKDFLLKKCTPHWMSEATELFKLEPKLISGDLTFNDARKLAREKTQLAEKCVITPASRIKSKLKKFEEQYK